MNQRVACAVLAIVIAACTAQAAIPENSDMEDIAYEKITVGGEIGRLLHIPAAENNRWQELMALRASDEANSMFAVTLGQAPNYVGAHTPSNAFFASPRAADGAVTRAWIEWGAGDSRFEAEVDLVPGQVFTVGASFIRIRVISNAKLAGVFADADIYAHVSLLPKGGTRHAAVSTRLLGNLPNGSNVLVKVPPFAKTAKLVRGAAAQAFSIVLVDDALGAIGEWIVPANADAPEIPMVGNAYNLRVYNNGAAASNAAVVFSLDL